VLSFLALANGAGLLLHHTDQRCEQRLDLIF